MHAKADFGMRLVGAPLADPRAVTSRKFMDDSVKQLSEFLASTGYMGEVTPARLLSPTSASFRSVMVHLLKMLDASYVVGPPDKFADEVQGVFKALRCGAAGHARVPAPPPAGPSRASSAQVPLPHLQDGDHGRGGAAVVADAPLRHHVARLAPQGTRAAAGLRSAPSSTPRPPPSHPARFPPRAVRRPRCRGGGGWGRRRGGPPRGRRGRGQQQPRVRAALPRAGLRPLHAGACAPRFPLERLEPLTPPAPPPSHTPPRRRRTTSSP